MGSYTGNIYSNITSGTTSVTNTIVRLANHISILNHADSYVNDQKDKLTKIVDKDTKNRLSQMGRSLYGPQKLTRKK